MTKKDFEFIAKMIGRSLAAMGYVPSDYPVIGFARNCSKYLSLTNSQFKREKFEQAIIKAMSDLDI